MFFLLWHKTQHTKRSVLSLKTGVCSFVVTTISCLARIGKILLPNDGTLLQVLRLHSQEYKDPWPLQRPQSQQYTRTKVYWKKLLTVNWTKRSFIEINELINLNTYIDSLPHGERAPIISNIYRVKQLFFKCFTSFYKYQLTSRRGAHLHSQDKIAIHINLNQPKLGRKSKLTWSGIIDGHPTSWNFSSKFKIPKFNCVRGL